MKPEEQETIFTAIIPTVRAARYIEWETASGITASNLYNLNTEVSAALYECLQVLEITLRTGIQNGLNRSHGENWVMPGTRSHLLTTDQHEKCDRAGEVLEYQGNEITPDNVVAALSLGFWTGFFGKTSETAFRGITKSFDNGYLKKVGRRRPVRTDMSDRLDYIRRLRNRVAHYEPILYYPLDLNLEDMEFIISTFSGNALLWFSHENKLKCLLDEHQELLKIIYDYEEAKTDVETD